MCHADSTHTLLGHTRTHTHKNWKSASPFAWRLCARYNLHAEACLSFHSTNWTMVIMTRTENVQAVILQEVFKGNIVWSLTTLHVTCHETTLKRQYCVYKKWFVLTWSLVSGGWGLYSALCQLGGHLDCVTCRRHGGTRSVGPRLQYSDPTLGRALQLLLPRSDPNSGCISQGQANQSEAFSGNTTSAPSK